MPDDKMTSPLFEARGFSLSFPRYTRGLKTASLNIIKDLNLDIYQGELVAIFGASGSGKSLFADAILGILPEHARLAGQLFYKGKILNEKRRKMLRGNDLALIPQTVTALDPLMKVKKQVQMCVTNGDKRLGQEKAFKHVGLPDHVGDYYPFELSGGMLRRVLVAMTMVSDADFIIADEPTPGVDVTTLDEMMVHFRSMVESGKSILMITHDIRTAIKVADRIAIFHEGQIVEIARTEDFRGNGDKLKHPYTRRLWQALPGNEFFKGKI